MRHDIVNLDHRKITESLQCCLIYIQCYLFDNLHSQLFKSMNTILSIPFITTLGEQAIVAFVDDILKNVFNEGSTVHKIPHIF